MKQSIWLQNYEKEVQGKRNKSNQNKKVIFIIIPIMLIIFIAAAMANGGMDDPQAQGGMMAMIGVFAVIMLFVIIMVSKGKKIDAAKGTRENVLSLLKTDEDVDYFDQQMSTAPIREEKIATERKVFLTMDYVGMKYFYVGDQQYRFARRKDIAGLDFCKTSSTGANPMRASYFFDVKGTGNEKLLSGVAETGKTLEKLEALLKEVNPDLVVTKKRTM